MYDIKQVQGEYKTKLISAEFAASLVKSNYRLHFGVGTGTSVYMDRAPWRAPEERHPAAGRGDSDGSGGAERLYGDI